jgi:hypothetical protein
LAGTVEFVGGAHSRSFVLDIDMTIPSAHQFFGILDGAVTAFDVSEAVVSVEGAFSAAIADFAEDETLRTPGEPNVLRLRARDAVTRNFVFDLRPSEVALEDTPQTLVLSASPRP